MLSHADIGITKKQASLIFGQSKQTVVNDKEDRGQLTLERLTYVEFLEAIGRVAVVKFLQSELEELPLSEKICSILDELFAVIDERRCEMTEMDGDSDT